MSPLQPRRAAEQVRLRQATHMRRRVRLCCRRRPTNRPARENLSRPRSGCGFATLDKKRFETAASEQRTAILEREQKRARFTSRPSVGGSRLEAVFSFRGSTLDPPMKKRVGGSQRPIASVRGAGRGAQLQGKGTELWLLHLALYAPLPRPRRCNLQFGVLYRHSVCSSVVGCVSSPWPFRATRLAARHGRACCWNHVSSSAALRAGPVS